MNLIFRILAFFLLSTSVFGQNIENTSYKTIHVFVALCDNENQGIVPVPEKIGNGKDAVHNLYWGAGYGVKHFLHKKSGDWKLLKTIAFPEKHIIERLIFKHNSQNYYLMADAYDGAFIQQTIIDFLKACSGDRIIKETLDNQSISFGGASSLLAYTGHDGLMEFELTETFKPLDNQERKAIVLACVSKSYFKPYLEQTGAKPLVWTTGLMAPEAYTLDAVIKGWIAGETDEQIRERAAQAYHQYQKCGIKGARNLLVTGW
jgi:hypothetical protein